MIRMPPKVVIEKHLRPNGLPEDLIKEIRIDGYQGPGEQNPWYWQADVERFVEERRPKSPFKKSYGEEGLKVIAANGTDVWERIASSLEQLVDAVLPRQPDTESAAVTMLTPGAAAKKMGVNVQTVREWCREGRLGVKAGRSWLISPAEVQQYLQGQLLIKGKVAG